MARYKVEGPDGQVFTIEGPDDATDDEIISFAQSQFSKLGQNLPKSVPEPSFGEVAEDVAKSAGIGLVEGGIGLATLPGNIESLGRLGINAVADLAGYDAPVSNETVLPTFDDWKQRVEGYTGEFYEPKTTAGDYANTIGQFATMAIGGPASIATRAGRVLAPALLSETAGQMTEGTAYEPVARLGGALVGGMAGPTLARRTVTPNPIPPERAAMLNTLNKEGVTALTAGQKTGNRKIRWAEEVTSDTPFTGGKATKIDQTQREQFTRAALRKAGIKADRATPDVIDDAFTSIGREYDTFAQSTVPVVMPSQKFLNRLKNIADNYDMVTPQAMRVPLMRSVQEEFTKRFQPAGFGGGGGMLGSQFAGIRSSLARAQRNMRQNPQAYQSIGEMIRALDAHMLASVPRATRPQVASQFKDMNRRYRNLLIVEDAAGAAGENAAMGLISPAALKTAVKKNDKKGYTRNRNDLAPLARSGEAIMRPLPQSGTGPRSFWQTMFAAPTAAVGATFAGAPGAAVGALAPVTGQAFGGRLLMSAPMQKYLSNQMLPGAAPAAELSPMQAALLRSLAASQGAQERGLTGRTTATEQTFQ